MATYHNMVQVMKTLELMGDCKILEPGVIEVQNVDRFALVPKYELSVQQVREHAPHLLEDMIGVDDTGEESARTLVDIASTNEDFIDKTKHFSKTISIVSLWVLWFYDHFTMGEDQYGSKPILYSRPRWTKGAHDDEDSIVLTQDDIYRNEPTVDLSDTKNLPIYSVHRDMLALACATFASLRAMREGKIPVHPEAEPSLDEMFRHGFATGASLDEILEEREIVCHTKGIDIVFRGTVFH